MTAQFRLHVLAVLLLLAAVWLPSLAEVAGLVFSASCAWLAWNLTLAMNSYRRFRDQIRASVLRC
jgi:hypothetical protein